MFWRHLSSSPVPFGELAWDHARQQLAAQGRSSAEGEIAEATRSLLERAHQGPEKPRRKARKASARDRRVTARTHSTAEPAWPRPDAPTPAEQDCEAGSVEEAPRADFQDQEKLADVVPLAVFDAEEEATRWW